MSDTNAASAEQPRAQWVQWLSTLHEGETYEGSRFRYGLLAFDLLTIVFIILTSFTPVGGVIEIVDLGIGTLILADLSARLIIAPNWKVRLHPINLVDLIAIIS